MATQEIERPAEIIPLDTIQQGDIPENASESTIFLMSYIRENAIFQQYEDSIKKIRIPEAKEMIKKLASEKKKYQSILNEYYNQFTPDLAQPISIKKSIAEFKVSLDELSGNADHLEIFQHAMKMEKTSFDFYENALERCTNKALQKIFRLLMECERKYYNFLLAQFAS